MQKMFMYVGSVDKRNSVKLCLLTMKTRTAVKVLETAGLALCGCLFIEQDGTNISC